MTWKNTFEVGSFELLLRLVSEKRDVEDAALVVNTVNNSHDEFCKRLQAAEGLIADFDGTLHAGNEWADMRDLMTPECAVADTADIAEYYSGALRTDETDIQFIFRTAERMAASRILGGDIVDKALNSKSRDGIIRLVNSFGAGKTCVVSFGLYDYILAWSKVHLTTMPVIMALKLVFSAASDMSLDPLAPAVVADYEPLTVVTAGNKLYQADIFRAMNKLAADQTVVLGDEPKDLLMMRPGNLGILIVPKIDPQPGRMEHRLRGLKDIWNTVSAVLISDSVEPLVKIRTQR